MIFNWRCPHCNSKPVTTDSDWVGLHIVECSNCDAQYALSIVLLPNEAVHVRTKLISMRPKSQKSSVVIGPQRFG
jgi:transcription elongation factor Elf1